MTTLCHQVRPLVSADPPGTGRSQDPARRGTVGRRVRRELREISPASAKLLLQGPPELSARCWVRLTRLEARADAEDRGADRLGASQFGRRLARGVRVSAASFRRHVQRAAGQRPVRAPGRRPLSNAALPLASNGGPDNRAFSGIVRDLSEGGLCLCLVTREAPPDTRDVCVVAVTPHGRRALGTEDPLVAASRSAIT